MKVVVSRNLYIILVLDALLLSMAFLGAHLIRFDFQIPPELMTNLWLLLFWVVGIKLVCFYFFDLYRGMWRYTGLSDLFNVGKALTLAEIICVVFILYFNRFHGVSRSVFIIDWCLSILSVGMLRVITRVAFEQFSEEIRFNDVAEAVLKIFRRKPKGRKALLIIGAGDCGEKICREIREDASLKYHIEGFLDDDPGKVGRKIHGIPVLDNIDKVGPIAQSKNVDEIVIAIPSLKSHQVRHIIGLCEAAGVGFKIIPSMGELIDGKVSINSVRPVEYRDLLGRKPVQLDARRIGRYLGGKCVMVTGAGGSIGQGLCRQVCRYSPKVVLLVERSESPLYEIDLELKKEYSNLFIVPLLADIQDREEMACIFKRFKPDIVFHAAAYKHVPMLERHPWKAISNNIMGTENMVCLAEQFQCDRFVFVSTDKAVNPANIMGASKRIAEIIVQNQNKKTTGSPRFITVRFGNVIGSVGSVIPLFKKQIAQGGPVTVTHPDMVRFFMLIPEACQLILQAGAMGKGSEIFVLEMGNPVKIDDMARDLIRFSGFVPDQDIKIEYTGLRPGEKLYEELMTDAENIVPTDHKKIMVINGKKEDMGCVMDDIQALKELCQCRDPEPIKEVFKKIVPEYTPRSGQ